MTRAFDPAAAGVMIDRADSADRDDAFWVERISSGWHVRVHIADVARVIPAGSPADIQAAGRGWTVYLPDRTIRMLPADRQDAAALGAAPVPTCLIELHVGVDGAVERARISRGRLRHGIAMSHREAAAALTRPIDLGPQDQMLRDAHHLALALLARRRLSGALVLYDLERGWATGESGVPRPVSEYERNAAYIIVQELMIAANEAVARWCIERDLPILFRNHRVGAVAPPREQLLDDLTASAVTSAVTRERLTAILRRAEYGPQVGGHYGLNLAAYTHATSPLRRYADLVTQRIVLAAVDGRPSPYSQGQLQEIATAINTRARELKDRKSQRLKQAATDRAHRRLRDGAAELAGLDAAAFHRVLKTAAREGDPPPALVEEITRRADAGLLAPRDICWALLRTQGERWRPARERLCRLLADDPPLAVTVVAMYGQLTGADPLWEIRDIGTVQQPLFAVTVTLVCGDTVHTSPRRIGPGKREGRQQAALGLAAAMAGLPDASQDLAEEPAPPAPGDIDQPTVHKNPIMTVNEHTQKGRLRDLRWDFTSHGPGHEPDHTCTVTATCAATGAEFVASATAARKADAKTQAAAALLDRLTAAHADAPHTG
ncbi:RNB domain-containing ribonuclease [Actinomadura miaoliensis]|uniref:DRBM domain-containing protein n=1 Tax=Actinomadura miaoliensis TaxID=430685 RepID=A0ABP7WB61_9ACTN